MLWTCVIIRVWFIVILLWTVAMHICYQLCHHLKLINMTLCASQSCRAGCPWDGLKGNGCAVGIKYSLDSLMGFVQ